MYGPALQSGLQYASHEMAQASSLPEPTRAQGLGKTAFNSESAANSGSTQLLDSMTVEQVSGNFLYSDDELAVLAESFFNQRRDFDGALNDWGTVGNI